MDLNNIFESLKKEPNAIKIKLGATAMFFARVFTDTYGVKSLEVVTLDECKEGYADDLTNTLDNNEFEDFERFVSVNEEGEDIRILTRLDDEYIREMVIFVLDSDVVAVRMAGKIDPSEVMKIRDEYAQ